MTPEKAQALLDAVDLRSDGNAKIIGDLARAYIAQAAEIARKDQAIEGWREDLTNLHNENKELRAELTRLRARVQAADELAWAVRDAMDQVRGPEESNLLTAIAAYKEAGE